MLDRCRSLFSPRRFLQTRTEVVHPSATAGRKQWVVARSLCLYRSFVLGDVPASERKGALGVRIGQWSPFAETGKYVVWRDQTAMVWIWDEEERRRHAQPMKMAGAPVVPEPLLWGSPHGGGLRVVKCAEGVEAQMWKEDVLATSRWWSVSPSGEEWSRFLLAQGRDPADPLPEVLETGWLDRPWGKNSEGAAVLDLHQERRLVFLVLLLFAFFLVWHGTSMYRWHRAAGALEERAEVLRREVEPLLNARNSALDYRQKAKQFLSLVPYPSQLELMAAVADRFPAPGVTLAEWHYTKGHLAFVLQGENLDPRYIVGAYEELPFFDDVIAERGQKPDRIEVKMVVKEKGIF